MSARHWSMLTPLLIGLFAARLIAEWSGLLLTLPLILAAVLLCIVIVYTVWRQFGSTWGVRWWLALLTIYILWPDYAPQLGLIIGLLVAVQFAIRFRLASDWWDAAILAAGAIVYIL